MTVKNRSGIIKKFNAAPKEVREYFQHLPELVKSFPYEVCIAYMFSRIERSQNMSLYCGAVKLHSANKNIAERVIHKQHITRSSFFDLFETVFGKAIPPSVSNHLKFAEKVRDQVVHGKSVQNNDLRKAIVEILGYANSYNTFVDGVAGFKPFGDLRGFKGRGKPLPEKTTRWLLKGLGFTVS